MSSRAIIKNFNGEQYERIRVLGKGSFGTAIVYRRQTDCALVVMKEIDLNKFKNDRDKLSALQEARIMSELSHQNIIEYYNAYTTETKLIIEMEYARIGTLETYLSYQNNQLLDEKEILYIFRQITLGLNYLHSKNIVHLDLKMANIFVTGEGTIKIGDFGIAQFMSKASTPSAIDNERATDKQNNNNNNLYNNYNPTTHCHLGTLAYSSPERCLGKPSSNHFKSDIWSLGCILYELITLKPLFASESLPELVLSITQVKYRPIERCDISPAVRPLFEQMIARDLNERPGAGELVCMIEELMVRLEQARKTQRQPGKSGGRRGHNRLAADVSTEAAAFYAALDKRTTISQINYPHSLIYQVRLDTRNILIDRVNLPQTKRIKEIAKGRSHYLVLTFDSIVYGWGSRDCGQLGACTHLQRSNSLLSNQTERSSAKRDTGAGVSSIKTLRSTGSARNSLTARDIQLLSSSSSSRKLAITSSSGGINNVQQQQASLTQPTSLASSTQTIVGAADTGQQQQQQKLVNHQLSKQLASILDVSRPATKPFIIQELNKRKIDRVAAGNDFSVFLSKTGILMTCGDGSTGCLGRGNLQSSLSPRMIDSLLNMDVVGIACGPEHVVAICGNGRVFTWGNHRHGRLGLSKLDKRDNSVVMDNKYVVLPQLVEFNQSTQVAGRRLTVRRPREQKEAFQNNGGGDNGDENDGNSNSNSDNVYIRNAFCGDRCTIFIDSNYACWACGENRFNKLGLDVKRRFAKSIVVHSAWVPSRIVPLAKYKIVSCSIGKNHTSFLTSEGKSLIFGQDIDHTYRLRSNMIVNRDSHRRISFELHTNKRKQQLQQQQQQRALNCRVVATAAVKRSKSTQTGPNGQRSYKPGGTTTASAAIRCADYKLLTKSLLAHNQLVQFKSPTQFNGPLLGGGSATAKPLPPKLKTDRHQRQQVEAYIRKSRVANKKMPFECVLTTSCTSKFTLALTNDNRVYFWGTRSHANADHEDHHHHHACLRLYDKIAATTTKQERALALAAAAVPARSIEPQLVANCSDECFIKIGSTNSTLMANIELLGSDQPIIHARDPRLIANSLADLWILDYQPTSSSSSSSSLGSPAASSSPCPSPSTCTSTRSSVSSRCSSCSCSASSSSMCSLSSSSSCSICDAGSSQSRSDSGEHEEGRRRNDAKQGNGRDEIDELIVCDKRLCQKHDAILEPQPIVSLYVPSMFNQNGCALKLVNLFCFDEDRFFLILDTTVKQLQQNQAQQHTSVPASARATNRRRSTMVSQFPKQGTGGDAAVKPIKTSAQSPSPAPNHQQQLNAPLRQMLNMVEESNSSNITVRQAGHEGYVTGQAVHGFESQPDRQGVELQQQLDKGYQKYLAGNDDGRSSAQFVESNEAARARDVYTPVEPSGSRHALRTIDSVPDCCQDHRGDHDPSHRTELSLSSKSVDSNEEGNDGHLYDAAVSPVSNTAFSLEEPRSMSTFMAASLGNDLIVGPSMNSNLQNDHDCCEPMRKLSFKLSHPFEELKSSSRQRRLRQRNSRPRSLVNLSESTTAATGDELDETSYMPTWVKNEYIDNQLGIVDAGRGHRASLQYDIALNRGRRQLADDSSSFATNSTSSTEQTCLAELSSTEHESTTTRATTNGYDDRAKTPGGDCTPTASTTSSSSSTLHDELYQTNNVVNYGHSQVSSSSCSMESCDSFEQRAESLVRRKSDSVAVRANGVDSHLLTNGQARQVKRHLLSFRHDEASSIVTVRSRSLSVSNQTLASEPGNSLSVRIKSPCGDKLRRQILSRSQPDLNEAHNSLAATEGMAAATASNRRRASSQVSKAGANGGDGGDCNDSILLCDNIINCSVYRPRTRASSEQKQQQQQQQAESRLASCSNGFQSSASSSESIRDSSDQSLAATSQLAASVARAQPIHSNELYSQLPQSNQVVASTANGATTDQVAMVSGRMGDANGRRHQQQHQQPLMSDRFSSSCVDVREQQTSVATVIEAQVGYEGGGQRRNTATDLSDQVTNLSRSIRYVSKKLHHSNAVALNGNGGGGGSSSFASSVSLNYYRGKTSANKATTAGSCTSLSSIRRSVMRIFC